MNNQIKSRALAILFGMLAWALPQALRAADGDLDPSFGVGGKVATNLGFPAQAGTAIALDADGRILVAGFTFDDTANIDFAVARYLPDGSLDLTFGVNGRVTTDFFGDFDLPNAMAIQTDGKIVLAGSATRRGTVSDLALARYNADGTLDSSFDGDGKVTTDIFGEIGGDIAYAVAVQPDGRIVVAGSALARYDPDGSPDQTFGLGGVLPSSVFGEATGATALALQADGKILVAGIFAQSGSATSDDWLVARFEPDGDPDVTFGSEGFVRTDFFGRGDVARALAVLPDGRIVAAGGAGDPEGPGAVFAAARYLEDGSPDVTFSGDGRNTTNFPGFDELAFGLTVQGDGKIVLAGTAANPDFSLDFALARYDANGEEDSTFGTSGLVTTDFFGGNDGARAVTVQADGKIIAAGGASTGAFFALSRYLSSSAPTFPSVCPHSAGYWKSHPAQWPVSSLTLGSQSYSATEIATLLKKPIRSDASLLLARELIAARFNLAAGGGSPELAALASSADGLLSGFAGKLPYDVPPGSSAGRALVSLSADLASWNNRRSSPGCGDSDSK
jgi:uncharacterized delta-60 repeat protein